MNNILKLILISFPFSCSLSGMEISSISIERLPFIIKICNGARDKPELPHLETARGLLEPYIASFENENIPEFLVTQRETIEILYDDIKCMIERAKEFDGIFSEINAATERLTSDPTDENLENLISLINPFYESLCSADMPSSCQEFWDEHFIPFAICQAEYFSQKNSKHQYDVMILRLLESIIPEAHCKELNEMQVRALSLRSDLFYNRDDTLSKEEADLFEQDLERLMSQSILIDAKFAATAKLYCLFSNELKKEDIQKRVKSLDFFEALIDGIIENPSHKNQKCQAVLGARLDIVLGIIAGNRKALTGIGARLIGDLADLVPCMTKKNRQRLTLNIVYRLLRGAETKIDVHQEWIIGPLLDFLKPTLKSVESSPSTKEKINTLYNRLANKWESIQEGEAAFREVRELFEEFEERKDLQSLDALADYLAPFKKRFHEGAVKEDYKAAWKAIFERLSLTRINFLLDQEPSRKRDREIYAEMQRSENYVNTDLKMITDGDLDWLRLRRIFLLNKEEISMQQADQLLNDTRVLAQQNRNFTDKISALTLLNTYPHEKVLCQQLLRSEALCEMMLKNIFDRLRPLAFVSLRGASFDIPGLCSSLEEIIMMIDGGHCKFRIGSLLLDNLAPLLSTLKKNDFIEFQLQALNMVLDRARQLLHSEYKEVIPSVYAMVESRIEALKKEKGIDGFMLQQVLVRLKVLSALITHDAEKIVEAEIALEALQKALESNRSLSTQERLRSKYMIILLQKAWLLEAQGKHELAHKLFKIIIKNCKGDHKRMAYLQYGLFLKKQGNYDQAINALDRALASVDSRQPDQKALLLAQRGFINLARNKKDAARLDFERVYATPRLYGYYLCLTKLALAELYPAKYASKSIELYQSVVVVGDDLFATRAGVQLAELHYNAGNYQEALSFSAKSLKKLDSRNPFYFKATAILGHVLYRQKKFNQASEYLLSLEDDLDQLNEPWKTNVANALLGYYITRLDFDQARRFLEKIKQLNIDCTQESIAIKKAILLMDSSTKQSLRILNRIINSKTSRYSRARAAYCARVCYRKLNKPARAAEMHKLFLKNKNGLEGYDQVLLDQIAYQLLIHRQEVLGPEDISMCEEMLKHCTPEKLVELDECALDRSHRRVLENFYLILFKKTGRIQAGEDELSTSHPAPTIQFQNLEAYCSYLYKRSVEFTKRMISTLKQKQELKGRALICANKKSFNELLPHFARLYSQEDAYKRLKAANTLPDQEFFSVTPILVSRMAGLR